MGALGPPPDVAPAALFRMLLRTPRPYAAIAFRFDAAPDERLQVRALHRDEWAEAGNEDGIVAAALCDASGAPVIEAADVGHLTQPEYRRLRHDVLSALGRIGPVYGQRFDIPRWDAALRIGAQANRVSSMLLAASVEQVGDRVVGAPEKFFGVPRGALLDGHLLAFGAAREVHEVTRKR